jgi:hypothetical protein
MIAPTTWRGCAPVSRAPSLPPMRRGSHGCCASAPASHRNSRFDPPFCDGCDGFHVTDRPVTPITQGVSAVQGLYQPVTDHAGTRHSGVTGTGVL